MLSEDEIRSALRQEGENVRLDPEAWNGVVERLGRRPSRPSLRLVGGAVAVCVIVAASALFLDRDTGTDRLVADGGGAVSTSAPQPASRPQPTVVQPPSTNIGRGPSVPRPPGPQPEQAVAITDNGRLVVIDVVSGREVRQLVARPTQTGPEAPAVRLVGVSVAPDRTSVYYATCCSPGVGATSRVPVAGGDPVLLADGMAPAVSPDGTGVAVVDAVLGVKIHGPDGRFLGLIEGRSDLGAPESVSWSPDGQRLVMSIQGRLIVLPATATAIGQGRELVPPDGQRWSSPVIRPDGSMLVVEAAPGSQSGTPGLVRAIAADGTPGAVLDLGGRVATSLGADQTGAWVVVATSGSELMVIRPDGTAVATAVRGVAGPVDW